MKNSIQMEKKEERFHFKAFAIQQDDNVMKVGTDAVLLGAWADQEAPHRILDIGTGSGIIALMLAQRFVNAQVTGIDIDESSIELASRNFAGSPFHQRLAAVQTSVQNYGQTEHFYDLIVSNPPFFSGGAFTKVGERQVMRHTTKLSHSELLRSVRSLLTPEGVFAVILPYLEGLRFIELAGMYHLHAHQQVLVRSLADKKVERILLAFRMMPGKLNVTDLVIQKSTQAHDYTEEYIALTQAFYLNMP